MSSKNPFDGDGFSREELSPDELAAHREAHHWLGDVKPTVDSTDDLAKGGKRLAVLVAFCTAIGGAITYAIRIGLFS